jgi:hypothetical protein
MDATKQQLRHPVRTLKQKAKDCGPCAERRRKIKEAWDRFRR